MQQCLRHIQCSRQLVTWVRVSLLHLEYIGHWLFFFLCWVSRHFVPLQWASQPRTTIKKSHFALYCPYYHKSGNSLHVFPSKFSILFSEWGFLSMDQLPTVLIYNKNSPSMVMDGDLFFLLGHAKPFDLPYNLQPS